MTISLGPLPVPCEDYSPPPAYPGTVNSWFLVTGEDTVTIKRQYLVPARTEDEARRLWTMNVPHIVRVGEEVEQLVDGELISIKPVGDDEAQAMYKRAKDIR